MNICLTDGKRKYCPECFSNDLDYDFHHAELYCNDCGLVVRDTTFLSECDCINYLANREEKFNEYLGLNSTAVSCEENVLTYGDIFSAIEKDIAEKKKREKSKK